LLPHNPAVTSCSVHRRRIVIPDTLAEKLSSKAFTPVRERRWHVKIVGMAVEPGDEEPSAGDKMLRQDTLAFRREITPLVSLCAGVRSGLLRSEAKKT
jgi:hypothetical protein